MRSILTTLACGIAVACATRPPLAESPPSAAAGCPQVAHPPADGPAPARAEAAHPDRQQRLQIFQRLVDLTRRYHVFAAATERTFGPWSDVLPRLEAEFARADTAAALGAALQHFGNSLHNPHCQYDPPAPPRALTAGFAVDVEWVDERPRFVVRAHAADLDGRLADGDVLVSAEGTDADRLLAVRSLESNANNWRGVAYDVARNVGLRFTELSTVTQGASARFVFRKREGAATVDLDLPWRPRPRAEQPSEDAIDYTSQNCAGLPQRSYGAFRLVGTGRNFCVYASKEAKRRGQVIVREFSFLYSDFCGTSSPEHVLHAVRADHEQLQRILAGLAPIKAVILDLRDNHGGNDANWFLDWWAPAPSVDLWVRYRLHEDLADEDVLASRFLRSPSFAAWYRAELSGAPSGRETHARAFFCRDEACDGDNRYAPRNQVTHAPTALLVGPGCSSSCDTFARRFAENTFGPLVGEPTAAAYTTHRLSIDVSPDPRLRLGSITLAVSRELSGVTGEEIEGVPLPLRRLIAPRFGFDQDGALVDAALEALAPH